MDTPEPVVDLRKIPFLNDKDLRDTIWRLARRYFRDEVRAEDVFQTTYLFAGEFLTAGVKVEPGKERGWLCLVFLNRARAQFKRSSGRELVVDPADLPDVPAADEREIIEQDQKIEAQLAALDELRKKHPNQAAYLERGDARKDKGGAMDAATRKAKQRAKEIFLAGLGAAVGGLTVVVAMLARVPPPVARPTLTWDDTTLAAASRELAVKSCATRQWTACVDHLEDAKRLNPSAFGPDEQKARAAAIASLRGDALEACEKRNWPACMDLLDDASKYDPQGDADPLVQLARSEAAPYVRGRTRAPQPLPDSKGPF